MKLTLHHLNLCSKNVKEMDDFYTDILDMKPEHSMEKLRVKTEGYDGNVAFITDGQTQVHVAQTDLGVAFRTGEAFKKRLDEKGVPYSDYGGWAMSGWHQIFFHDPDGNVIEVHQAPE
jgi:glyoxylase I family protein